MAPSKCINNSAAMDHLLHSVNEVRQLVKDSRSREVLSSVANVLESVQPDTRIPPPLEKRVGSAWKFLEFKRGPYSVHFSEEELRRIDNLKKQLEKCTANGLNRIFSYL